MLSDRRQKGCFLWEAAPKRIRQDGKKETKRPGDAFHVLYGGGEEGLLVHVAAVSYTHLDVYKRQSSYEPNSLWKKSMAPIVFMHGIHNDFFFSYRTKQASYRMISVHAGFSALPSLQWA